MKIALVTTHNFPVPYRTHTGEYVIKDLARSLSEMGHEIYFVAPAGSYVPSNGHLLEMPCGWGKYPPTSNRCETDCFNRYSTIFREMDIVHDFSNSKCIAKILCANGRNTISTFLGGGWNQAEGLNNICVWSESMKKRALNGWTDYHGTNHPEMGGPSHKPVKNVHVVHGGIDTDFYTPSYEKEDYFLYLNRWHEIKGYRQAIELAKQTGIKLVLSGEHPDNELFEHQKNCALEAVELSKGWPNISVKFLPQDPEHHLAKREMYRKAKALLYPVQFQEPWGLSQTEGLSCGTPVVGTNYGSVPEVIQHGVTGFVCENTINSFAEAVKNIDSIDPKVCRQQAVDLYDRKVMAKNYLKEYQNIIDGKSWG